MAEEKTEQTDPSTSSESSEAQTTENEASKTADAAAESSTGSEPENEKKELTPEEKIAKLEAENADLKDQLLRRAADFDNYRKRMYFFHCVRAVL